MHDNPHRIYYVHAARRLADLIINIRQDKITGADTINIVAHSQGTEISMLANFMVVESGQRPVDCLILCDSPYGLDPTEAEMRLPGKHQSREARVQTLANFTRIMQEKRRPVDKQRIIVTGVAKADAWAKETHSRDNAGRVYNYFCPQDSVVSLPNIQGMGWKGVDSEALKALGPNFVQRVFSNGHIVGKGNELFRVADGPHTKVAGFIGVHDGDRVINGDPLPEPYTFHTLTGKDRLGEHLAGTALAKEGAHTVYRIVDIKTAAESSSPIAYPTDGKVPADVSQIQSTLNAVGYTKQIVEAWYLGVPVNNTSRYLIRRYETQDEALSRLGQRESAWSQHSAILLHHETIEKCIAFDLAIGLSAAFDENGGELWWELLQRADWRNPKNPDANAKHYYTSGVLPDPIKRQMNKPVLPTGVVNAFATDYVGASIVANPVGAIAEIKDDLFAPHGGTGQWPLPEPDVRG
ncbi:hypothetical protein BGV68_01475 [Burkholderia ubonensis]|nr:hypothetical protein BGV68_01475 [Burkholderia ubonensis]